MMVESDYAYFKNNNVNVFQYFGYNMVTHALMIKSLLVNLPKEVISELL